MFNHAFLSCLRNDFICILLLSTLRVSTHICQENSQTSDTSMETIMVTLINGSYVFCIGSFLMTNDAMNNKQSPTYLTSILFLTSASCLSKNEANTLHLIMGSALREPFDRTNFKDIDEVIYHPEYNETTHFADLAVVRFRNAVKLKPNYVALGNVMPGDFIIDFYIPRNYWSLFTWKNENNQIYSPFLLVNQSIIVEKDGERCPASNTASRDHELGSWYMYICVLSKNDVSMSSGTMLVVCKSVEGNMGFLNIGLHSFSYKVNEKTIMKFTMLQVYKYWIQFMIETENNKILHRRTTVLTTRSTTTEKEDELTSKNYNYNPNSVLSNYYGEFSYDNILMGANPCDDATILHGYFLLAMYSVIISIFTLKRFKCL